MEVINHVFEYRTKMNWPERWKDFSIVFKLSSKHVHPFDDGDRETCEDA